MFVQKISVRSVKALITCIAITMGWFASPAAWSVEAPVLQGAERSAPWPGVRFTMVEVNDMRMRVAQIGEPGEGETVIFSHGFPESWYSWRHQLSALADAGYHVLAPDMRGYGGTDAPEDVVAYSLKTLAADMVGVLDALGVEKAHFVGHDWGAPVATSTVVRYPERALSLSILSVPYGPRSPVSPLAAMRARTGDNFFYMVYHNEPGGVAEAEYDANTREFLSRIYLSPDSPRHPPEITDPKRSAGGWVGRLGAPKGLPGWLTQTDLDYYVAEFDRNGFRGGVNYYRNFDLNWTESAEIEDPVVRVPTVFIAGTLDLVINGADENALKALMANTVADLRGVHLFPGIGHWVQQEAPEQTNRVLLQFLGDL